MNGLNLKSICLSETIYNFPNNLRPYGSFPSTFVTKLLYLRSFCYVLFQSRNGSQITK